MDKNVAIGCKIALRYILLETELAKLGRWDLWSEKMSSSLELQQVGRCYYLLPKGSFGSGKSRQKNQSNNWPWNWCICNVFYEKSDESCSDMAMAPHSSTLAWKNPWVKEPDRLQSMGSLRVGHDWETWLLLFTFSCIKEGNGNPLQCSCLENPRDGGAWLAAIYGVAQSRTRLKQLSSSSSSSDMGSAIH